MKKSIVLATALVCFMGIGAAHAEKTGFINDPELAQKSTALQGLQMQHDKMLAVLRVDLEKEAKAITEQRQKLEEDSKKMTKAEVGKRLDSIEKSERELQMQAQAAVTELRKNLLEAAVSFKEKVITPVIKDLAKEKGFDAVLNSANAFYVDEDLDVTAEAIKRINKKMPKVDLKKVTLEQFKKSEQSKKSK